MRILGNDQSVMEAALQVRSTRAELLAEDVANADTPNFQLRDINFDTALQQVLEQQPADGSVVPPDIAPENMRVDRNNVDVNQQMGQVYENSFSYLATLRLYSDSLKQGDVHIGKAVAHLTGTFNNSGATPSVAMKLTGADMPASDLESVLPAVGVTLPSGASLKEGTMNVDLAINGPVDKLVTTGPVKLSNGKLAGFDLGAKMGALSSFAGIPKGSDTVIETFSSNLRVAPEGIRADNLNLVVPAIGSMTGSGTIGADQALNFQMVANLSASNSTGPPSTGCQGAAQQPADRGLHHRAPGGHVGGGFGRGRGPVRIGVVTFPGSNSDVDSLNALTVAGVEAVTLWHESPTWRASRR